MALLIVLHAVAVTEVSTAFMYFWHQAGNTVCGLLEFFFSQETGNRN